MTGSLTQSDLWASPTRFADQRKPGAPHGRRLHGENQIAVWNLKPTRRVELNLVTSPLTDDVDLSQQVPLTNQQPVTSNTIVFDPASRSSFRIGVFEDWLLRRCDGRTSVRKLAQQASERFSDENIEARVLGVLANFYATGLLSRSIESDQVWGSPQASSADWWTQLSSRLVVWRLPGINIDSHLQWLAERMDWLYSRRAVVHSLACLLVTSLLLLLYSGQLIRETQIWNWLTNFNSGFAMLAVFLLSRAAHELGHAIVCRRHGVRCPDIGVLLVLGAPCLYCDVSESWKLPRRASRAAIAAAGMYTELCIAMAAAWIWMLTFEGPSHTLALQTMFICSISTVVINANPLMRFDGYYLLADWLDEVNLRQKADQIALRVTQATLLGIRDSALFSGARTRSSLQTLGYTLFSASSGIYRWGLVLTIAAAMVNIYTQWQLPWVGRILALLMVAFYGSGWVFGWWKQLGRAANTRLQRWRFRATVAGFLFCVLFSPLPQRTFLSGWIRPVMTQGVYAPEDAVLLACTVRDEQSVQVNDRLFELSSPQIVAAGAQKSADHAKATAAVEYATATNRNVAEAQQSQKAAEEIAARAKYRQESLRVKATTDGYFTPSLASPARRLANGSARTVAASVESWSTLQWSAPEQLGRRIAKGTKLGEIQSHESIVVLPLVGEALAKVAEGMRVKLRIPSQQYRVVNATVERVVNLPESPNLTQNFETPPWFSDTTPTRTAQLNDFAAIVQLPSDFRVRAGSTVDAVVRAPPQSLAGMVWKWMRSNVQMLAD